MFNYIAAALVVVFILRLGFSLTIYRGRKLPSRVKRTLGLEFRIPLLVHCNKIRVCQALEQWIAGLEEGFASPQSSQYDGQEEHVRAMRVLSPIRLHTVNGSRGEEVLVIRCLGHGALKGPLLSIPIIMALLGVLLLFAERGFKTIPENLLVTWLIIIVLAAVLRSCGNYIKASLEFYPEFVRVLELAEAESK